MSHKKKAKKIKQWLKAFLIALIILWFLKTFFFEFAIVKNDKMENTLFRGDVLFISKLTPGPRLPITLLSIPFFGNTIPFSNTLSYLDWITLPYLRIPLWSINRNDILAFNYPVESDPPVDKKTVDFKRCVALPGDTIRIHDKKVFVNQKLLPDVATCKYRYRISAIEPLDSMFYAKYQIKTGNLVAKPYIYDVILSSEMADSVAKDSVVKNVQILKTLDLPKFFYIFPYSPYYSFSLDYFGPLIVPSKGKTVYLTKENIYFYKQIIQYYEHNKLNVVNDSIFYINDKQTSSYTFKYNYYFVLDDNRDQAKDSRYWGFLPETHIIGKVKFVLFNLDEANHRTFKHIK